MVLISPVSSLRVTWSDVTFSMISPWYTLPFFVRTLSTGLGSGSGGGRTARTMGPSSTSFHGTRLTTPVAKMIVTCSPTTFSTSSP